MHGCIQNIVQVIICNGNKMKIIQCMQYELKMDVLKVINEQIEFHLHT